MADAYVQVQPDSTGKKVDTSQLTVAATTVERQRIIIADTADSAGLVPVTATQPSGSAYGLAIRDIQAPPLAPPSRGPIQVTSGQVMFVEDFSDAVLSGMFNDGCGSAAYDNNVRFNGKPSVRLDPQGNQMSSSANSVQLTLGGSPQTIGAATGATFTGTSSASGSPAIDTAGGYIILNTPSSSGSWQTTSGNSAALSYASGVVSGSTGNWTVTFSGVNLLILPGSPDTSITTQNIGTATMVVNNPSPSPGTSPNTNGVVWKRRVDDQFSGRFGHSAWLRPTSKSSASANTSVISQSLYNRDGTNFTAARLFWQLVIGMNQGAGWNNDNTLLWYLSNAAPVGGLQRWVPFAFSTKAATGQHSWDPVGGTWDRAGVWHYAKIVADFAAAQYVSIQVDETLYTAMAGQPMYVSSASGAKTMHFSVEFGQTTGTRRFWNAAKVTGTVEP